MSSCGEITRALCRLSCGGAEPAAQLLPLVYDELRRLASKYFQAQPALHTLQPTALVHEAYLRLVDIRAQNWENRAHFFAVAARAMRQILVDHARGRFAAKRGGDRCRVSLDADLTPAGETDEFLIDLDEALKRLGEFDAERRSIVELRFFGGLTVEETAHVLGVSPRSVDRGWSFAKAWLHRQMREAG